MCDPVSIGLVALKGIGTAANINSQNAAAVANAENAKAAGNDEIASTTEQYLEQSRSLIQGGFDAILEGRAAESTAYASAIENGVQGSSVKALMRDKDVVAGRNRGRTHDELDSLETQLGANLKHIGAKTTARINSVPTTSFGIGDAANILAPIVQNQME